MRLLREIARLRKQIESHRTKTRGTLEECRRACIASRELLSVSDDCLDGVRGAQRRAGRQREPDVTG
jgi:hypothetical protein